MFASSENVGMESSRYPRHFSILKSVSKCVLSEKIFKNDNNKNNNNNNNNDYNNNNNDK